METFLHAFDLSNQLKCANFASRNTIDSLFVLDLIIADDKQNPRHVDLELLRNCTPEIISGHASTRMIILYQATILKHLKRVLTQNEQNIIRKADVEIEFERVRRLVARDAPSRLSALFLVEDNEDGRITLGNMLRDVLPNPKVCQVQIFNPLGLIRADHRWFEHYFNDPKEQHIINYWSETPASKIESWEYLLEGSVTLANESDFDDILTHTKNSWPDLSLFQNT